MFLLICIDSPQRENAVSERRCFTQKPEGGHSHYFLDLNMGLS